MFIFNLLFLKHFGIIINSLIHKEKQYIYWQVAGVGVGENVDLFVKSDS